MNSVQEELDKCWTKEDADSFYRFTMLKRAFRLINEIETLLPRDAYRCVNSLRAIIKRELMKGGGEK